MKVCRMLLQLMFILMMGAMLSSCYSTRVIQPQDKKMQSLKVGDEVKVITTDGRFINLEIDLLSDTHLEGNGYRFSYEEIASIEKKNFSIVRTAGTGFGLFLAGIAVVFTGALLIFAAQGND